MQSEPILTFLSPPSSPQCAASKDSALLKEDLIDKSETKPGLDDTNIYFTKDGPVRIVEPVRPVEPLECGMYMAESAIPNSGWGMYTAVDLKEGETIEPIDLAVHMSDPKRNVKARNRLSRDTVPTWLMEQYYWNERMTGAVYDAKSVDAIIPSYGMLANSHPGLLNLDNAGCKELEKVPRDQKHSGAYTNCRKLSFVVEKDLAAGHELFAEYGDSWFRERTDVFGYIPLRKDYKKADQIAQFVYKMCNKTVMTEFCQDFWKLIRGELQNATEPRVHAALPPDVEDVESVVISKNKGSAYHFLPNVIRPIPWLQENGMCLDNIQPGVSKIKNAGHGAFATRDLPTGTVVVPAPLIHMHRDHLGIVLVDDNDNNKVLWKGHQLLLNYCYSHPSTSLVFFPYSPVANFINHSRRPNVHMRWSSQMKQKDWLHLTTQELLEENEHAGLMLEFVAIRDIEKGEEVVVDYGQAWDNAWYQHRPKTPEYNPGIFEEASDYSIGDKLPTEDEEKGLPEHLMTVCWIDEKNMQKTGKKDVFKWTTTRTQWLDDTKPCWITVRNSSKGKSPTYDVRYKYGKKKVIVKGLPGKAIKVVERPYSKAQYLRHAFRHEINMPDEMIPNVWRDREMDDYTEECGLFMAESAIPNSGLGMFTAVEMGNSKQIFSGEIVIQVQDYSLNRKLRHWLHETNKTEEPKWLLDSYFWNAETTLGEFEARRIYSIVPALGMLANSHPGLVNARMRRPTRESGGVHRTTHASAGAFSTFHDIRFVSDGPIEAGAELYADYGDSWFERRTDLGLIPLKDDFLRADELLQQFNGSVKGNFDSDKASTLWKEFWKNFTEEDDRVKNAIPRALDQVKTVFEMGGTAKYSVPDRVRSISWLKENGKCLDNIRPGISRIEGAHRGAFATRRINKGDLIAPAPLVHIHRNHLKLYDSTDVQDNQTKPWYDGEQLLLNYVYGHSNSSVLLFPYSPVVNYINHDRYGFNAELRWSDVSHHRPDLMALSPDELMKFNHSGLVMEFVATRDIEAGDEVLLDYGEAWDQAWKKWVTEWRPPKDADHYVPAYEFNDYLQPVRTEKEQKRKPYPENVITVCYADEVKKKKKPVETLHSGEPVFEWKYRSGMFEMTEDAFPCDILQRDIKDKYLVDTISPNLGTYTVRIHRSKKEKVVMNKVPRTAIEFFDDEYTSDLFLNKRAFRHEIQLPDHMVPQAWKDLQPKAS
jgi:hypothetical protein